MIKVGLRELMQAKRDGVKLKGVFNRLWQDRVARCLVLSCHAAYFVCRVGVAMRRNCATVEVSRATCSVPRKDSVQRIQRHGFIRERALLANNAYSAVAEAIAGPRRTKDGALAPRRRFRFEHCSRERGRLRLVRCGGQGRGSSL